MTTQYLKTSDGTHSEYGSLAYDVTGNGPLVICVPGMGDSRKVYRFLVPPLSEAGYRVASMDLRGHGESSTKWADFSVAGIGSDILALIHYLGGDPAIVIGSSMAAGAAVWAAVEEPQSLRGMTLIGPFVRGGCGLLTNLMMTAMFSRPWGPAAWLAYYKKLYPTRKPDDFTTYSASLRTNLSEPGRMEALLAMLRATKQASETRIPRVTTPALVLMGSKDPDFKNPAGEAAWVAEALRGEYRMIADAGHYPHAEFPAQTAALILPFMNS